MVCINKEQSIVALFCNLTKKALILFIAAIAYFYLAIPVQAATLILDEPIQNCSISARNTELTWTSDISGSPVYVILRKLAIESDSSYIEIGNISGLNFNDNTGASDKNYNYKIKATKGANTYFSNSVAANATYCSPVLYLTSSSCGGDGPINELTWSGVTGDVSKYEILRKNITANEILYSKVNETNLTSYNDTSAIIGTNKYSYIIRAVWSNGNSAESQNNNIIATTCAPNLAVNSACNSSAPGGPVMSLAWNNLLGVARFEVYRKAQSEASFTLLNTASNIGTYTDNLVQSLPFSYWNGGNISYFIKAVWIKDSIEITESSAVQIKAISRCAPFVSVAGMCDAFNNPEMHLSWTKTWGADLYNIYRDDSAFISQVNGSTTTYVDYLNSTTCPGGICAHSYRNEASVAGFSNFISDTIAQNIDCVTVYPPSPDPVVADFGTNSAYCQDNKSKINISWTPSSNAIYYTLYRNGIALINLSNTSYVDAGVESSAGYTYSVRAFGKSGTSSGMSAAKSISAASCVPPAAPTFTLTKSCNLNTPQINISWSVTSSENITNFEIKRGLSPSSLSTLAIVDRTTYSKTDSESINPSTAYYYQIVANSVLGVTPSGSLIKSITTNSCLPSTPSVSFDLYCSIGNPMVKVKWTVLSNTNTDHFEVFRQDISTVVPVAIIPYSGTSYSWIDTNPLAQSTAYSYKVVAVGQLNTKIASSEYIFLTTNNCVLPADFVLTDPPSISCQESYPRSILSWTPSSNTIGYDLIRNRLNSDNTVAETVIFSNTISPYADFGLGNALNFAGNNYIDFGLSDLALTGNLTIEFWANPSNITSPARQNPICKSFGGEFCLTVEPSGQLSYYHGSAGRNSSPYIGFATPNVFENNKWVHVVITRDRTTRTMKSYKNGVFAQSMSWSSGYDPVSSSYNLFIGKGYVNNFKGIIDEVRIYNRVLSDTEAQDHFRGIYAYEGGLIGLWHFDEGSGQYVSNSRNNNSNGVLGASYSPDLADPVWINNGLRSGEKYNWQVKANGPMGVGSTLSNTTSASEVSVCAPSKVGLSLMPLCQPELVPSIRLAWSYSINAEKYEIYRDAVLIKTFYRINSSTGFADPEFISRTWDDNNNGLGLNSEFNYSYYIKAIGSTELSSQSDNVSKETFLCLPPSGIANLIAIPSCSGSYLQVALTWDSVSNVDYYTVYRNGVPLTPNVTVPSFMDTTAEVNTYYTYKVRAFGPGGSSESDNRIMDPANWASNNNNFCTPSVPVITSITGLCLSNAAYNTINWSDATVFNTQQYKIYRNTTNDFTGSILARTIDKNVDPALFSARSWNDTGLTDDQYYYYWIKAIGPVGGLESPISAVASRRTNICTLPAAPEIGAGNISDICTSYNDPVTLLRWDKTPNTTSYNIYKNGLPWRTINSDINGYIKKWLLIGGYSYSHTGSIPTAAEISSALSTDYLGGETTVRPRAGKSYGGKTWFDYSVPANNYTDFTLTAAPMSSLTPKTYAVAYAFAYIYSPIAQPAQLRIGSDDGVKAFLNGAIVHMNTAQRGASPDQDIRSVNLVSGINTLLIKVQQGTGGWGLYARITDLSGNSILNNEIIWDSEVIPNLSENYSVSSTGPGGTSSESNSIDSAPLNCNPLIPVVSLVPGCNSGNTQMTLSWPADPNTYYWAIYKKRSSDAGFFLLNPPGNVIANSYIDMDVASNTGYDYYVRAFGSGGIIKTSDIKTEFVTTCYNSPIKPTVSIVPQCAGTTSRMKVKWDPYDNSNTLSFNIHRKDITAGDADYTIIFENLSPSTVTEFVDGGVAANHEYSYKVEAIGSGVDNYTLSDVTPASSEAALDCLNIPPFNPPLLSLNFTSFTVATGGAVSLRWIDTQNETKYKVYRRIIGETQFTYEKNKSWLEQIKEIFLGAKSDAAYDNPIAVLISGIDYTDPPLSGFVNYIDNSVVENTIYEYQIVAINNAGGPDMGQTYSNIISPVYVPIAIPVASVASYIPLGPNTVKIKWVRPSPPSEQEYSAEGHPPLYEIQRSSNQDFDAGTITVIGAICDNIITSGTARACSDEIPNGALEFVDNNASLAQRYYRVVTENFGGRAPSASILGYSNMKWREVAPK